MAYRSLLRLAAATTLGAFFTSAPAWADTLLDGLGGPAGYGSHSVPPDDDGSYCGESPGCDPYNGAPIDVASSFPNGLRFFGMTFRQLYLNNNGNITFGGALSTFTPASFPIANQRMIAPWWGDVDTRGAQSGFAPPMHNGVYWTVSAGRFVATWHNVGYFSEHDDLENDFQLILTDRSDFSPGDFDVEFRYHQCRWTTGDASSGSGGFGGTPAQAGFDAGNLRDFYALPGSLSMAILNVCNTSNVNVPGRWDFQIRSGIVAICGNGTLEPGEGCDDGNTRDNDGCSSHCQFERDDPPRPDVVEDVIDDWAYDAHRADIVDPDGYEPPDVLVTDAGPRADHVSPDAGVDAAECDGWRCGRETWLQGSAGPVGSCTCSVPGAGSTGTGRAAGAVPLLGAFGVAVWRRARRRGRTRGSHRA